MAEKIIRIEDRDGVQHELIPSAHTHTPSECGAAASNHTHSGYAASDHTHDDRYYTESEVDTKLSGKADSNHTHTGYASATHNHSGIYAPATHEHTFEDVVFEEEGTSGHKTTLATALDNKADTDHDHDGEYSAIGHTHSGYAASDHTHDDKYSAIGHTHDYSGTYAAINHTHNANYKTLTGWNMYSVSVYGVETHVVTYNGNYLSSEVNASSYIKVPSGKTKVVVNDGTVQKGGVVIFRSIMSESETNAYIIIDAIVNP